MQGSLAPTDPGISNAWFDTTVGLSAPIISSSPTVVSTGVVAWGFQTPINGTACFNIVSVSVAVGSANSTSITAVTITLGLYEGLQDLDGIVGATV